MGVNMEYTIEDLLPIVAKLTEKYTSKESSSVTYETARMLMETVIYCINEAEAEYDSSIVDEKQPNLSLLYERGLDLVIEKTKEAKNLYDRIIDNFENYGCVNYSDTILKGMPAFFTCYDAKFHPQNHILTLDYPLIIDLPNLCGIDLILAYLKGVLLEKHFLHCFDRFTIRNLLINIIPDYQTLYFDNLSYPVLLNAVGRSIVKKPLKTLLLKYSDCDLIKAYFNGDDVYAMEQKIKLLIQTIVSPLGDDIAQIYFAKAAKDYAARIQMGIQYGTLDRIFLCTV